MHAFNVGLEVGLSQERLLTAIPITDKWPLVCMGSNVLGESYRPVEPLTAVEVVTDEELGAWYTLVVLIDGVGSKRGIQAVLCTCRLERVVTAVPCRL